MRLEDWARAGPWKAGILSVIGGLGVTCPCLYLRKIVLRNWTGEDGGRESRQKAGAEIQRNSSVGMEEGCFARHLGTRAGRNGWAMEEVSEAGGPFGFWLSQLCGWRCHTL